MAMAQQMTFAAVARLVNESWHRVHAVCPRYVDLVVAEADLSAVSAVAIDDLTIAVVPPRGFGRDQRVCTAAA
jgi:hypothetical protein